MKQTQPKRTESCRGMEPLERRMMLDGDVTAFMGGAQNTNEECYLFQKAARLLGTAFVEHQARL